MLCRLSHGLSHNLSLTVKPQNPDARRWGRPGSSFPEGMVRAREFRLRQDPGLLECSREILLILIIMIRMKVRMIIVSAIIKCFNSTALCTKPLHQFDARLAQVMGCAVWGFWAFYRKALSMSGSMSKEEGLMAYRAHGYRLAFFRLVHEGFGPQCKAFGVFLSSWLRAWLPWLRRSRMRTSHFLPSSRD